MKPREDVSVKLRDRTGPSESDPFMIYCAKCGCWKDLTRVDEPKRTHIKYTLFDDRNIGYDFEDDFYFCDEHRRIFEHIYHHLI